MTGPRLVSVGPAEAGQKLLQFLGRLVGGDVPRSALMRWIRTGQVRVDGRRAKPFDRLEEGCAVRVPPFAPGREGSPSPLADSPDASAAERPPLDLPVLARTDDLLVLAKPAGLPVHPGSGWTDSVQTRLAVHFAGQAFIPTIAHRLDRDTSGVLVAAMTYRAIGALHQAFRDRETRKEYLAWVRGAWSLGAPGEPVEMLDRLAKSGPEGHEKVVAGAGREARAAATPLLVEADRSLVRVRLFTGRTHQIRAQLSARGHPIVGDAKYGGGQGPMFLHAWRLTVLGETFVCPPPWEGAWAIHSIASWKESE